MHWSTSALHQFTRPAPRLPFQQPNAPARQPQPSSTSAHMHTMPAHLRIVGRVAIVAAIGPVLELPPIRQPLPLEQGLVHPVPDEAALRGEKQRKRRKAEVAIPKRKPPCEGEAVNMGMPFTAWPAWPVLCQPPWREGLASAG